MTKTDNLAYAEDMARLSFAQKLTELSIKERTGDAQLSKLSGMPRKKLSDIYGAECEDLKLKEMARLFYELGYELHVEGKRIE